MRLNGSNRFQSTPPVKAATRLPYGGRQKNEISIHAAREGGDIGFVFFAAAFPFQSTPPVKAATGQHCKDDRQTRFQSTPPVKAATRRTRHLSRSLTFQSTPPVKAATIAGKRNISLARFQSTPPVKAATVPGFITVAALRFQSTPPVKAATLCAGNCRGNAAISIHAAREGGDRHTDICRIPRRDFNPRRP